jgi:hypothetical protein
VPPVRPQGDQAALPELLAQHAGTFKVRSRIDPPPPCGLRRDKSFTSKMEYGLAEPKLRSSEGWWARQGSNL